ncbi:MAG TPA: multicopper oxidase domain-containing protein, partial [Acidimicrobiales bacterium]
LLFGPVASMVVRLRVPQERRRSVLRTALVGTAGAVLGATVGTIVGAIVAVDDVAPWLLGGTAIGGIGATLVPRRATQRRGTAGTVLLTTVAVVMTLLAGAVGTATWVWAEAGVSNVGELDFSNELRIPPLADSTIDDQGRLVFDLDLQEGSTDFLDNRHTKTWGVNGAYLGPTLRARRGEQVLVNLNNQLPEATTMHWHGMHLPAAMDGGPHQVIDPGTTWSPTWTIDQPAASLWYHPHPDGETADHMYRGIAGMFILDDDVADGLGLPSSYGVDDLPVIIQDRSFGGDGSFSTSSSVANDVGKLGDKILVNGTYDPYQTVTTELVRLRLLNASNTRTYDLGFTDDRSYWLVGTDSGLVEAPVKLNRIQLSPGERAEIVVRFKPGDKALLRSYAADLNLDFFRERVDGAEDTFDILQFRAADDLTASADLPDQLVPFEPPAEADAVETRHFELGGTAINGHKMDMGHIDAVVHVDTVEVWVVSNQDGPPHNFHIHDVHFAVLSVDGEDPPLSLRGWKDTVPVLPGKPMRLIMEFTDYTDPNTPYMFHCHVLQHEDQGMMGQFVVVRPGEEPG